MTKDSNCKNEKACSKKMGALSVISYVALTIAIIFCAAVVFQIVTQGYVSIFGYSMFRVVTPSMEPTIPTGALIISQKTDIESVAVGDIICFSSLESYMRGRIVTHRVVEVKTVEGKINLLTRGDANNSVDGYYVTEDNLIGKMIFCTEKDNFFVKAYEFITHKNAFFLVILLPLLLVAVILIRRGILTLNDEIGRLKQQIADWETDTTSDENENRDTEQ